MAEEVKVTGDLMYAVQDAFQDEFGQRIRPAYDEAARTRYLSVLKSDLEKITKMSVYPESVREGRYEGINDVMPNLTTIKFPAQKSFAQDVEAIKAAFPRLTHMECHYQDSRNYRYNALDFNTPENLEALSKLAAQGVTTNLSTESPVKFMPKSELLCRTVEAELRGMEVPFNHAVRDSDTNQLYIRAFASDLEKAKANITLLEIERGKMAGEFLKHTDEFLELPNLASVSEFARANTNYGGWGDTDIDPEELGQEFFDKLAQRGIKLTNASGEEVIPPPKPHELGRLAQREFRNTLGNYIYSGEIITPSKEDNVFAEQIAQKAETMGLCAFYYEGGWNGRRGEEIAFTTKEQYVLALQSIDELALNIDANFDKALQDLKILPNLKTIKIESADKQFYDEIRLKTLSDSGIKIINSNGNEWFKSVERDTIVCADWDSISLAIHREMRELGIKPLFEDKNSATYFKEDTAKMKSLDVDIKRELPENAGSLISASTPNLFALKFYYDQSSVYTPKTVTCSITDKDLAELNLPGLTVLHIENQRDLTEIDVSKFPNLKKLTIDGNLNLRSIKGLEMLQHLEHFSCVGNEMLHKLPSLSKVVASDAIQKLNLDVNLFPDAIGYDHKTANHNPNLVAKIHYMGDDCTWKQAIINQVKNRTERFQYDVLSTEQMINMHNKACDILHDNIPQNAGVRDIVIGVERYLAENVVYNNYELCKGDNRSTRVNGGYAGIVDGACVCEGYTRSEQYMLKLRGIDSHNAFCYVQGNIRPDIIDFAQEKYASGTQRLDSGFNGEYHSVICVDGYYGLYSDPTWNARNWQKRNDKSLPYSLRTKSGIQDERVLSFMEIGIRNEDHHQNRGEITKAIDTCELFKAQAPKDMAATSLAVARGKIGNEINRSAGGQVLLKK